MAALLIFGVILLAFLCGRLQVTVTHLRKELVSIRDEHDALVDRVAVLDHDMDALDARIG